MQPAESQPQLIFGFPLDPLTMEQVLERTHRAITERSWFLIGVVNAAKIVKMRRNPVLRSAVLEAHIIVADGMSVVWASRLIGRPLPERVNGTNLMNALLERGAERGYRFYCLGATEDANKAAVANMEARFPGVQIVGRHHGYFDRDGAEAVARDIEEKKPDVLFVGMTSPKKEDFLARWAERMQVPVCHGVGGSFDVAAGLVSRAPPFVQRVGMEWFWRMAQEPMRLGPRYLVTNTAFCVLVAREVAGRVMPSLRLQPLGQDGAGDSPDDETDGEPGQ